MFCSMGAPHAVVTGPAHTELPAEGGAVGGPVLTPPLFLIFLSDHQSPTPSDHHHARPGLRLAEVEYSCNDLEDLRLLGSVGDDEFLLIILAWRLLTISSRTEISCFMWEMTELLLSSCSDSMAAAS